MSDEQTLDISNVISVSILSASSGLDVANINTAALLTRETKPGGWGSLAFKNYKNSSEVLTDWGSSSPVYKIAASFFAQQPNVLTTGGYLTVVPILPTVAVAASGTIQDLVFTAKTAGTAGNSITLTYTTGATKGAEVVTVDGSDITVQIDDASSIAAEIKEAIDASVAASALVSVALVAGHETDAQVAQVETALTGGLAASNEAFEATIARTINSVFYFGVLVDVILTENDLIALSAYVQTLDKVLFYASRTAADFAPGGMLDDIRTASKTHTRALYYYTATAIDTQKFAAAYAGRALSTDFTGINTTQTMHLKQLASVTPDQTIDQTALDAAKAAGVDVYCSISGRASLSTSGENSFFDQVYNSLWFKNALQVAGFNYLAQTSTKIPQTEEGMEGLKGVIRKVCEQARANRFVAPGSWTSDTVFGNPADLIRNITDQGYYVYSLPVAAQAQADRDARRAPLVQIAIKESGALHSASIIVNVNH
jgi:hypothetical protein